MYHIKSARNSDSKFDVSIVGIVGLPGRYGGFETLADQLVQRFGKHYRMQVFCTQRAQMSICNAEYLGAKLSYVNWDANGWQSIPYDFVSLLRAAPRSRNILVLGVSGCLLLPIIRICWPRTRIITNIDGLEWKRRKWGHLARLVLRVSEWFAVRYSHEVIADNYAIQQHVRDAYGCESSLIAYGGDHAAIEIKSNLLLSKFPVKKYYISVCRIEPENNVREILQAFAEATDKNLVFIGNWGISKYSSELRSEFGSYPNIELKDPIYDIGVLANLRHGAIAYVHGHSAGGTNPSLVEAMSIGMAVLAYDVSYNRHTTDNSAAYWSDSKQLVGLLNAVVNNTLLQNAQTMACIAAKHYTWDRVAHQYKTLLDVN